MGANSYDDGNRGRSVNQDDIELREDMIEEDDIAAKSYERLQTDYKVIKGFSKLGGKEDQQLDEDMFQDLSVRFKDSI